MTQTITKWKKDFYTISFGQAISIVTSGMLQMAIIWYLTAKTNSAAVLSMATLIGFLPRAILGSFIGVFIDRYDRKKIMIFSDLFIAFAGGILAITAHYIELPTWLIMFILCIRSIGAAFHSPSLSAITPTIVPEHELLKCSGYSQSIESIGFIISPVMAGILYASLELKGFIIIDIAGAIIASITVLSAYIPKQNFVTDKIKPDFFKELKDGFLIIHKNKKIFSLLIIGALYMMIFFPINALFPLMSMGHFRETATFHSYTESGFAVGMLIGGIALGKFGGFNKKTNTVSFSIFLMGISLLVSGVLPPNLKWIFVICCFLMGFSCPFYAGSEGVLYQENISPEYLGRAFSLLSSIASIAMPFGLILAAKFTDKIGVANWFLLSGFLILILSAISIFLFKKIDQN